MNECNYTEPLSPVDETFIMKVLKYLAVELKSLTASEADILSAIEASGFKCLPRGMLSTMILHGYATTQGEGDKIRLIIKEKGGEIMEKPNNFKTRFTSGEEKVAKSVLDHFKEGFKVRNPSRVTFESCLEAAFPKIENGKAATTNLINKGWLKEVDGKIFIGPEGEKYLSP